VTGISRGQHGASVTARTLYVCLVSRTNTTNALSRALTSTKGSASIASATPTERGKSLNPDYETWVAIQQDRVEEAERRIRELEERISLAKAVGEMSPFGFFHVPRILDGDYSAAQVFIDDVCESQVKWLTKLPARV
jgi:hypothetical protein